MALAVLSYPELRERDLGWIESCRQWYDRLRYAPIAPHFTFVFPTAAVASGELVGHVRRVADGWGSLSFVIRCGLLFPNMMSADTDLFLVPDEGFSDVVRLHDALYSGLLESELRLDVPFIPHITLGYAPDAGYCKQVADELNANFRALAGTIQSLDVAEVAGDNVRTVERIQLLKGS